MNVDAFAVLQNIKLTQILRIVWLWKLKSLHINTYNNSINLSLASISTIRTGKGSQPFIIHSAHLD